MQSGGLGVVNLCTTPGLLLDIQGLKYNQDPASFTAIKVQNILGAIKLQEAAEKLEEILQTAYH